MLFLGVLSNHPEWVLHWDINSKRVFWTSQDALLNKLQQQNYKIERWFSQQQQKQEKEQIYEKKKSR